MGSCFRTTMLIFSGILFHYKGFANLINLSYTMNDYGKVTAQSIPEGTIIDSASMLEVTLGGSYGKEKTG